MIKSSRVDQCSYCGGVFRDGHHCREMSEHSEKIKTVKEAIVGRIKHTVSKANSIEEWKLALVDAIADELMDIRVRAKLI